MERKLNNVDKSLQEILITGDNLILNKGKVLFLAKIKELQVEIRYWEKLRRAISGATHKRFRRVWKHHEKNNCNLSNRDICIKLRDVEKDRGVQRGSR